MSQIVFLNHYNTLSVSTIITNESHQSKQFQLKVEIVDKQLQKALQTKELLVGEDEQPPGDWKTNGHIYQIKKKTEVEGGTTFNIHESISEKQDRKSTRLNSSHLHDALPISNEYHQSKQFQLKVEIVDKQLQKALQTKELLVGEDEQPPGDWKTNGHIYQIKKKTEVEGGTTFNIHESISEK